MDNCNECRWDWRNACGLIMSNGDCYKCPNFDREKYNCLCAITLADDDCPYFENYYGGDDKAT